MRGGRSLQKKYTHAMQNLRQTISYFSPIIVCASSALLWCANPAKAILNINIYDDGPNLKVVTSGSLSALGSLSGTISCGANGSLVSWAGLICTGIDTSSPTSNVTGPPGFGGAAAFYTANSVSGPSFVLSAGFLGFFYHIDPAYVPGQPFLSSATFNNTSLAAQGFTAPGLVGTWTINGTSESINLFVGPPSPSSAAVPGPLPLVGAGAAFGWSRRMRRRLAAPVVTPPRA